MGIRKKSIASIEEESVSTVEVKQEKVNEVQDGDSLEITEKDDNPPKIKKERSELQKQQFRNARAKRLANLELLRSQKAERELSKRVNHLEQKALKVLTKKMKLLTN